MIYVMACASLILIGLVYAGLDIFTGISKSGTWTITVLVLGFLAAFLPSLRKNRSVKTLMCCIALFAVFSAGVVTLHRLEDSPIERFQAVYWNIHPGMTIAEVENLVNRKFPDVKPSIRWHPGKGFLGLEPVDKDYNAEFIEIWLNKDVVTGTRYLPD